MADPIRELRAALLRHYRAHRRDLPWRRTRDPYAVWVSEIMLQQTRVDTVTPRYAEFLERFPTVERLAGADVEQVCEAWAGLGYYRRARNLHAAAVQVVATGGGRFPTSAAGLQRLPGIGRYTAGAIASIAFGEEAPVVDGNVVRVLSRLYAIAGDPKRAIAQKQLWQRASDLVRGPAPGDLNQALMELGALVCTPRSPRCGSCPVRRHCAANVDGTVEQFPEAAPPVARRKLDIAYAWARGRGGVWLQRRPLDGLWAGLWEPPSAEGGRARKQLEERLGVPLSRPIARIEHQLSHREVTARVYRTLKAPRLRRSAALVRHEEPLQAALSTLARKAIRAALDADNAAR